MTLIWTGNVNLDCGRVLSLAVSFFFYSAQDEVKLRLHVHAWRTAEETGSDSSDRATEVLPGCPHSHVCPRSLLQTEVERWT